MEACGEVAWFSSDPAAGLSRTGRLLPEKISGDLRESALDFLSAILEVWTVEDACKYTKLA